MHHAQDAQGAAQLGAAGSNEDLLYDAIIIGGGVGGLTAAAQMVAKKLKVLVLEK